jgi:predicted nuclease of restriction endonuclease-like (RecB) superfamily
MSKHMTPPTFSGYAEWLAELKARIHTAQQRATLVVNRELVLLYWQIGRDILDRQASQGWGSKVVDTLARDLRNAFPDMKGFSPRNLKYMRAFAEAWPDLSYQLAFNKSDIIPIHATSGEVNEEPDRWR